MRALIVSAFAFIGIVCPAVGANYANDHFPEVPLDGTRNDHVTVVCPAGERLIIAPAMGASSAYLYCRTGDEGFDLLPQDQ